MKLPRPNWGWASLPFLLLVWIALASRFPSYVLPQPWVVAAEARIDDGSLWKQFRASALEELVGFGSAAIVAVIVGTAAGLSRRLREFVAPLNSLLGWGSSRSCW